jgi:hypothetical protein
LTGGKQGAEKQGDIHRINTVADSDTELPAMTGSRRPALPGGFHGILCNQWIGCEQGEFMLNGLTNQHPIERISKKSGQARKKE